MATRKEFRVLVATDGSRDARAAVTATLNFPWPEGTRVRVISARRTGAEYRRSILLRALDRGAEKAAESARRTLSRRWPDVETDVVDKTPTPGILDAAARFRADVTVVGWRGHGSVRRLLMGSVSRGVVRGASGAVLVVPRSQRVRAIVVGFDGSPTAKRAVALVGRLAAPPNGRVTLVNAAELMPVPSGMVPGAAAVAGEVRRQYAVRARTAARDLERAAAGLIRRGWHPNTVVRHGEPLRELLGAVAAARAQLLVVGARGKSGVRRLLLGSVAEGALSRSPVAVLVVR
jgi:nucleotide-binding universal stress UspA family protein